MKKTIYIIPGLGETCQEANYNKLAAALRGMGFIVHQVKIDWYKPLSKSIFKVEKSAIVIGFSLGAVIAYLIAKKYGCKKVVFASMSPIHDKKYFGEKTLTRFLRKYMSQEKAVAIVKDIKKIKINLSKLKTEYITIAGDKETDIEAEYRVPKTGHKINKKYIEFITKFC